MKVSLIDFTGKHAMFGAGYSAAHYAAALLVFTKSTRLNMTAGGLQDFLEKPHDELFKELTYISNTIPSSHEFIDYTFMVEGVTRAFTHQFVRTRTASFAQQTMRVLDVSEGSGWDYGTGPTIPSRTPHDDKINYNEHPDFAGKGEERYMHYHGTMHSIGEAYKELIAAGAAVEDARGILPTNILTNIVAKMNMRTFVELVRKRSSSRTQGEYRDVLEAMKAAVRAVHPFIDLFIDRTFDKAANELDVMIRAMPITKELMMDAIKRLDQMRAQS